MNILIICHYGLYTDLSFSFAHHQAAAYVNLGQRVRVLIPIPLGKRGPSETRCLPALERKKADGAELCYVRFASLSNLGEKRLNVQNAETAIRLHTDLFADGFRPDVIQAHTLGFDSELGARLKKLFHCPLVVTAHGSDVLPVNCQITTRWEANHYKRLREYADRADMIVCVSSKLKRAIKREGTRSPVEVVLNGFAASADGAECGKTALALNQTGSLIPLKKTDVTIRAFAKLCAGHGEAVLRITGQGPERSKLQALCHTLGIADRVCFLGQLENRIARHEMSKAQFFVMPSVNEGFGIVYLEAMSEGCITIGTEGEGIADLIRSGENGFLVPPDAPEAIVSVIEWCLDHPEESAAIAERGRRDALELTWERNAKQYIGLFERLTEQGT